MTPAVISALSVAIVAVITAITALVRVFMHEGTTVPPSHTPPKPVTRAVGTSGPFRQGPPPPEGGASLG